MHKGSTKNGGSYLRVIKKFGGVGKRKKGPFSVGSKGFGTVMRSAQKRGRSLPGLESGRRIRGGRGGTLRKTHYRGAFGNQGAKFTENEKLIGGVRGVMRGH